MGELATPGTVLVVVNFFFFFETALAADGGSNGVGAATYDCITCARVGDRDVRMSGARIGCGIGIAGSAARAAHASAARASAARTHTHASATHTHTGTTTGVDDDMGHARMTSDNLSVHRDGGHPTSHVGYLLAFGFDASRPRELVPVSEL